MSQLTCSICNELGYYGNFRFGRCEKCASVQPTIGIYIEPNKVVALNNTSNTISNVRGASNNQHDIIINPNMKNSPFYQRPRKTIFKKQK